MMELYKLNRALFFARIIYLSVCGCFSLFTFLLLANIAGSVITSNTSELPGVVIMAAAVGAVTVFLYVFAFRQVSHVEKDGTTVELINYVGGTVTSNEREFIKLGGSFRFVTVTTSKGKKFYFNPISAKYRQDVIKLFPFAE